MEVRLARCAPGCEGRSGRPQPATGRRSRGAGAWELGWGTPTLGGSRLHLLDLLQFFKSGGREAPVDGHLGDRGRAEGQSLTAMHIGGGPFGA